MRIDKFLNSVNITKRRSIAEDMLEHKVVFINEKCVKKSKLVKLGDIIKIQYLNYTEIYLILSIPTTKSTPKNQQSLYVKKQRV